MFIKRSTRFKTSAKKNMAPKKRGTIFLNRYITSFIPKTFLKLFSNQLKEECQAKKAYDKVRSPDTPEGF